MAICYERECWEIPCGSSEFFAVLSIFLQFFPLLFVCKVQIFWQFYFTQKCRIISRCIISVYILRQSCKYKATRTIAVAAQPQQRYIARYQNFSVYQITTYNFYHDFTLINVYSHGYVSSCPDLSSLLRYCPSDTAKLFSGSLPWDVKEE